MAACGGGPEPVRPEDWLRVGVDPVEEARVVEGRLTESGWGTAQRVEGEGFVALAFEHPDGRRAVRVVTSRGVAVALDSHEPDGIRERHGPVSLVELDEADVDRDGRPEVVAARDQDGGRCIAILQVGGDGLVQVAPTDAEELAPGACPSALEDVDGDGVREVLVELRWPELALDEAAPTVRAALVADEGAWRATGAPVSYLERETERRLGLLARARQRLDVAASARIAVELAALAHLGGASPAAQVRRFDDALAGMVLTEAEQARVAEIRAVLAAGWRAPEP